MPHHIGNTHSVFELSYALGYSRVMAPSGATSSYMPHSYTPDYSHVMAQFGATPSYVPFAPTPHLHGPNFLAHSYSSQRTRFASHPAPPVYYAPLMQPTPAATLTPLVSMGQLYAQHNPPNKPFPNNQ